MVGGTVWGADEMAVEKDKFEAFLSLAEFRRRRCETRQQIELKLSISLWALMAAALIYIPHRPPDVLLISVLTAIFLIHALFLGQIWVRNENDQDTAFFYLESAENVLAPLTIRSKPSQILEYSPWELWFGFLRAPHLNWMTTFEMLVTAGMSVVVYMLAGQMGCK